MNKENKRAFFTLFVAVLFSTLSVNIFAQTTESAQTEQPQISVKQKDVLQSYIDISSLPKDKRKEFFSNLSAEEKANLFKTHLALQFVKRPNLTTEQKELILETISFATPNVYDKNNKEKSRQNSDLLGQKAKNLFSKQEFFEIFADLSGETTDISLLRKYQDISNLSTIKRKEVLRGISAYDKSNLWKFHFASYLIKLPILTSKQMKLILDAVAFITPELYGLQRISSEWKIKVDEPAQLLTGRAFEVFTKDEVTEIFANLGGKIPVTTENDGESLIPVCHCSRQWLDCYGIQSCGGLCSVPPGGGECGFGGLYDCNGWCR
ncbi:MAG TPA: bacteriocin fulvocin C-related protein [Pyrinomonadaceae bacterium]|nr:bacteriocin fulvocin C-related protein [Pyrinomonadaceae bacterium]